MLRKKSLLGRSGLQPGHQAANGVAFRACVRTRSFGEPSGAHCRSLGCPGFPVRLGGVGELHAPFLTERRHTRSCPAQRGRKSGYARDDKGEGSASIGVRDTDGRSLRRKAAPRTLPFQSPLPPIASVNGSAPLSFVIPRGCDFIDFFAFSRYLSHLFSASDFARNQ